MIFTLPSSGLLLLATVMCVAISCRLAAAVPLTPLETEHKQHCSSNLAETIDIICKGRTRSLMDNYPQSIGQRVRRLAPDEVFYRPLQNGPTHDCCNRPCGYAELRQFCAPD